MKNLTSWLLVNANSAFHCFVLRHVSCSRGRFWTSYIDVTCNDVLVNLWMYFIRIHIGLSKFIHPILWNMCCQKKRWYHTNSLILIVGNVHPAPQYMHASIFSYFLQPEGFVHQCFKNTAEYSFSFLMCAGCFYSHSLWETTRDGNAVVLDPEIKSATNYKEYCNHQRSCISFALLNLLYLP